MNKMIKRNSKNGLNKSIIRKFFKYTACIALASTINIMPCHAQQIITDGNTNTSLNVNGTITDVTTTTIKGNNAFNSFSKFNVDAGNTVNLHLPSASKNLINLIYNEKTQINGVLNSIQNAHIGGNIFLVNHHGITVGSQGVINFGSLTAVTPTTDYMNNFFDSPGNPDSNSVSALLNGTVPVNPDAVINIEGKINAITDIKLDAGSINNAGEIYTGANFQENNIELGDVVNVNTVQSGAKMAVNNGEVVITTSDLYTNTGKLVSNGGNINIDSGFTGLGGEINAGGGTVNVTTGTLSLADKIISKGGTVNLNVAGKTWETSTSLIDVSGPEGGTINHIAGQQITTSGHYLAIGNDGNGG